MPSAFRKKESTIMMRVKPVSIIQSKAEASGVSAIIMMSTVWVFSPNSVL
jgi:hypothetical protein